MTASFFFYDYESFGVHPAKDRPAQFAGLRTDLDFNPIGEPVMFYCKQTPDYLPAPEAVMVTAITPQLCNAEGLPEPEFAARIHHEFSQPETCIVGFNNIRFDDEMTRYTFFRNFFDPYEYSYKNGNSRWDLLDLVRACYALRPEGIEWVVDEAGVPNFRLENLTQANGIEHSNAHDAMADVYATIAMAKLIKQKQPKFFDYFFQLRHKEAVKNLIDVGEMTPLVHISGMFGNARGNTSWVVPLEWHPTNKNAVIVFDLTGDADTLLNEPAEVLKQRLYTKREALAEGEKPVTLKLVHINKCPILAPAKVLTPELASRLGIDREHCLAALKAIKADKLRVREKVLAIFSDDREFAPNDNVETQLYDGFFTPADKNNMAILRKLLPEQLAHHGLSFADARIEPLLFHYRARHYPESLSRAEQIRWQKWCHQRLDERAEAFSQSLTTLMNEHQNEPDKLNLLDELAAYAEQLSAPVQFGSKAEEQPNLVSDLNKLAEEKLDKAEKLKRLKALIPSA